MGTRDQPWSQFRRLEKFFKTGQVCVIDGANGTEIQRRGGKPAETFSSGTAALTRPDLCQEVHEAYLDSGADVIITHSYSSNSNVMASSGNGDRVVECILSAAALARRATLVHAAKHAAKLAHAAAASNAAANQAVQACAMSTARMSTSGPSNDVAESTSQAGVVATQHASDLAAQSVIAMREVACCAAAAAAAAAAASAASEGEEVKMIDPPTEAPAPVPMKGWDAAGFGPAIVAGSLSAHPPEMPAGGSACTAAGVPSALAKWPPVEEEQANYNEAARAHMLSGVDMLFLELMKDEEHAPRVAQAAATTGLPVFLGMSARTDQASGKIVLLGDGVDAIPLTVEWFNGLRELLGTSMVGVNVHHTKFDTVGPVLKFLREEVGWTGPIGAYPDHGEFKQPGWSFVEVDNSRAVDYVEEWITKYNVQMVGGCCGLGPDYIKTVSAFIRHYNACVRDGRSHTRTPRLSPISLPVSMMEGLNEARGVKRVRES